MNIASISFTNFSRIVTGFMIFHARSVVATLQPHLRLEQWESACQNGLTGIVAPQLPCSRSLRRQKHHLANPRRVRVCAQARKMHSRSRALSHVHNACRDAQFATIFKFIVSACCHGARSYSLERNITSYACAATVHIYFLKE